MRTSNDIATWRSRIFSSLLTVVLLVGALATVPVLPFLINQQLWSVALADGVALAWIFAIRRFDGLSYHARVAHFLAVVYCFSIALTLSVGPAGMSYLLGPPVVAAIMLGTRPAMLLLALGAATLVALGTAGHVTLNVPGLEHQPLQAALLAALNYTGVGAMLTLTCGTLLQGLARSLGEAHELNGELELTSAAVARLNDMVVIAKAAHDVHSPQPISFANDAFLRRTGYARDEIIGHNLHKMRGPDTDPDVIERIVGAMAAGQPCNAELICYAKSGEGFWVELELVPFARDGARASHWVLVGRDITERRTASAAIDRLAFFDGLTGLPNRRRLMQRLDELTADLREGRGLGAVLYIDIDNFKQVNDARGHATGDALLVQAARRLERAVRREDTVARIGGDEFVVLLARLGDEPSAATCRALAAAGQIRLALAAAMEIDGQAYTSSACIGVALPTHTQHGAQDLLREADTAMYRAKAAGRNGIVLFETSMLADAQRRLALERDLAVALERGELIVHLQPQVSHEGKPSGAEVLLRWRRADGSMVPPDRFIPVAETTGLIVPLGGWVLHQACESWLKLDAAGVALPLSVNVSPLQFRHPDFTDQVRAVLQETGTPPQQLIFEVTEGLLIEDTGQTLARMGELAALGIRFSIDDFGTGYSNLAYLKRMPLYELKIDRSFMRDTPHDANGTAIVQSILAMAGHLGLRVVAEGIESEEQARFLAAHGRPCMQGYLFHRPMPLGQLIDTLCAADGPASISLAGSAGGRGQPTDAERRHATDG